MMNACLHDSPRLRPRFPDIADTLAALRSGDGALGIPPHLWSPHDVVTFACRLREECKPAAGHGLLELLSSPGAAATVLPLNPRSHRHEWPLEGLLAAFVAASSLKSERVSYRTDSVVALLEVIDNAHKHRLENAALSVVDRTAFEADVWRRHLVTLDALWRWVGDRVDVDHMPSGVAPFYGRVG
jgi:hypothetical protein